MPLLNALGLVLMWALFARDYRSARVAGHRRRRSLRGIDAGLWFRDTDVDWYVGASGALHGVMAAGTLAHLRRGDLDGWILAVFIVAEARATSSGTGRCPSARRRPVVVNAHLYGAIGGLAALGGRP